MLTKPVRLGVMLAAVLLSTLPLAASASPASNASLVKTAMIALFVKRDPAAVDRYWGKTYTQHNPVVPNGVGALPDMITHLPPDFRYEPGMVIAQGNLVAIHGRYTGFGPKPMVAVDIFRIDHGKLVEHWDVLQPEVPASESKSGNPMFDPREKSQ